MAEEEIQLNNEKAKPDKEKKIKKKKQLLKEDAEMEEQDQNQLHKTSSQKSKKRKEEKAKSKSLKEEMETEEENGACGEKNQSQEAVLAAIDEGKKKSLEEEADDKKTDMKKINKRKRRLLKEAAMANKRGICYLSRVPPHMDPFKLRQLLSQYGEIQRIYLVPEKSAGKAPRKRGRFQEQGFSEGWAEFSDKRIAKRVANMLNGEQIGGRKRSSFYYDLWNIKYLSKFKWDDLTEEIAYNNAAREQKLALEISAAKRERDFYLSKVDQARALSSIEKRLKKKQKLQEEAETNADLPVSQQSPKVVRKFQQKQPVADNTTVSKPRLSKDILAGVFGSS